MNSPIVPALSAGDSGPELRLVSFDATSPAFLDRLIGAFPGGVSYVDNTLVFTYCNDVQASYFGRSVQDVLGKRLHDVAPANPAYWLEIERVVLTGQQQPQAAEPVTWPNGEGEGTHNYLVNYIADFDREGAVLGVFMTALEVAQPIPSEREIALRERNKVLEEMIKERDFLVGVISHELRNPLTTIFGNAHMLLRRLEDMDSESRIRAINDIREEAERLNRMVENMLLLARAGGQAPVPTEPILVERVIAEVVAEHKAQFRDRVVTVSVKPPGLMADGQPGYMKQVIQNLLSNAEKYSPAGGPIDIRARRKGNEVVVSIFDRGPGVLPGEAEIIFQPFYRSDRTSTKVGGAGIGLAVCKLLVQAQSGRIWTTARRGGGSSFSFSVPLVSPTSF